MLQSDMAQAIFDIVKDYEDDNNRVVSETFMKLPSKRCQYCVFVASLQKLNLFEKF